MKMLPSLTVLTLCGLMVLPVLPALSAAESIGLNFSVAGNADSEMEPDDAAGQVEVEQSQWNNLPGVNGTETAVKDSMGADVKGLAIEWKVPPGDTAWRSKIGESWGFSGSNLKLQKGYIQLGGSLTVGGIPYSKYDVYVYLNAGDNGGNGRVVISSPSGGVSPDSEFYYKFTWLGGKFVVATSKDEANVEKANCVVFPGNAAKQFTVDWKGDLGGGWTGVSGIQIVEAR